MPTWGPRNTYPATVLTVTLWVAVAAVAVILRSHIPTDATDPALQRFAAHVKWRPSLMQARAESRKTGRPVLVVLFRPTSSVALAFFSTVDASREMVHDINEGFIPVQVNLDDEPGMDSVYLPLFRVASGAEPGFQAISLDRNGHPADQLVLPRGSHFWREPDLFTVLAQMRRQALSPPPTSIASLQADDMRLLNTSGVVEALDIDKALTPKPDNPYSGPRLEAYLAEGRTDEVTAVINGEIAGNGFDWTHRSFIVPAGSVPLGHRTAESLVTYDADRVLVLEQLAGQTGDPAYRSLAKLVFDSIMDRLISPIPVGAVARQGDDRNRVCGVDWMPEQLSVLGRDADSFRAYWHLDRMSNPELRPHPSDWKAAATGWDRWSPLFTRLSSSQSCTEIRSLLGSRATAAYVGWRLWPVVSAWGDADRIAFVKRLTDPLLALPNKPSKIQSSRSLNEPVTVSLALFARYQATGDTRCLVKGRAELESALTDFKAASGSIAALRVIDRSDPLAQNEVPDVIDEISSSSASRMVDALWLYGCATPDESGLTLRSQAQALLGKLAPAADSIRSQVDGLVLEAKKIQGGTVHVVLGVSGFKMASSQSVNEPGSTWVAGGDPLAWNVDKEGAYTLTDKGLAPAAP